MRGPMVYYSAQDWLDILTAYNSAAGFLLAAAGLSCLLLGWRIVSVLVPIDYGLIGALIGYRLAEGYGQGWLGAAVVGAVLAVAAWMWPRYATILLAAMIGGYCCGASVVHLEGNPPPVAIAAVLGFFSAAALGFVVFEHIAVIISAVQGGVLVVAGAIMVMYNNPGWYGGFREMAVSYRLFLPMMILGPTIIGVFFQLAEIQEHRSRQVKV